MAPPDVVSVCGFALSALVCYTYCRTCFLHDTCFTGYFEFHQFISPRIIANVLSVREISIIYIIILSLHTLLQLVSAFVDSISLLQRNALAIKLAVKGKDHCIKRGPVASLDHCER